MKILGKPSSTSHIIGLDHRELKTVIDSVVTNLGTSELVKIDDTKGGVLPDPISRLEE